MLSTLVIWAIPELATDHRRATAERNVNSIVEAAEALLHEDATPTIAAVAKRAGVSRVTVYAHFATLESLLAAVLEGAVARAAVAFDEATSGVESAMEALELAVTTSWESLTRHRPIAEAAAAYLSPEIVRRAHDTGYLHARRLFEAGVESGEFRNDVPVEWLLSVYYALLHAAAEDVRAGRIDGEVALAALRTTIRAAFSPRGY